MGPSWRLGNCTYIQYTLKPLIKIEKVMKLGVGEGPASGCRSCCKAKPPTWKSSMCSGSMVLRYLNRGNSPLIPEPTTTSANDTRSSLGNGPPP